MRPLKPNERTCWVCGSAQLNSYAAAASDTDIDAHVSMLECNSCHFAWQFPVGRTVQDSVRFFETAYAVGPRTDHDYFNPERKRIVARLQVDFIETIPTKGRRLLDIGAGAAIFADEAAARNWDVTAIDPAMDPDRANSRANLRRIRGTLESLDQSESFDVVTLWDVIEHVEDPVLLVTSAARRLNPGGWLVLETGNFKSADRLMSGKTHWIFQLDHRWYFSPDSLEVLLTRLRFDRLYYSPRELRPGWQGSVEFTGPSLRRPIGMTIRHPLAVRTHLKEYLALRRARSWRMAGIGIFTVAAQIPA